MSLLVSLCLSICLYLNMSVQSTNHAIVSSFTHLFVPLWTPYSTYHLYSDGQSCDVDEKYVTLADRNPNIHKQGSLSQDYVAYRDHWLQFIFPGCLSRYPHPFANEISTALSSRGYIGISQIPSNKQLTDEMEFHIYENMNLKLSRPWKIYEYKVSCGSLMLILTIMRPVLWQWN